MDSLPELDAGPALEGGASLSAAAPMRRYLAFWAGWMVLLLLIVIGFCAVADPYAVLGTPRIAGFNAGKPAAAEWPRVTKAYTVFRARPRTLVLGNSNADVGFDPQSGAWPETARPVFNLAIDGGLPWISEMWLRHALAGTSPSRIVIAANFIESQFTPERKMTAAQASLYEFLGRMRTLPDGRPNPGYSEAVFADYVFSTLSFQAVADSIRTLLHQDDSGETYETELGFNDGGKFRRWAHDDGFGALFLNKDASKIPQMVAWSARKVVDFQPLLTMVRLAHERGIAVDLLIVPNHADLMEAMRLSGLDPDADAWKRALVKNVAAMGPGAATIWDFTGYSAYTTEPVPPLGDRQGIVRWFWEPIHFRPELGDVMLRRALGKSAPTDFGVVLTPSNVDGQIAAYHRGQAAWEANHPGDVARIGWIVSAAAKVLPGE